MGRLKKYKTAEEKLVAKRLASKQFYWDNKDEEDKKARKRYHRNIQNNKPKR